MPGAAASLITTPFDQDSTAADVVEGVDPRAQPARGGWASAEGARIVSVSSSGHLRSPVVFDDLDYAFREYDPLLEGVGGRYFEDCNEAPVVHRRPEFGMGGVAFYAVDPGNAGRLWEVSLGLIG